VTASVGHSARFSLESEFLSDRVDRGAFGALERKQPFHRLSWTGLRSL